MKKNIFLIFWTILISGCHLSPDTLETPTKSKDPFEKNPYTHLPSLPSGFGPSRGPTIFPRYGKYLPDDFYASP